MERTVMPYYEAGQTVIDTFSVWSSMHGKTCNCKSQPNRQSCAATWRTQTRSLVDVPRRFRLLSNYFCLCLF